MFEPSFRIRAVKTGRFLCATDKGPRLLTAPETTFKDYVVAKSFARSAPAIQTVVVDQLGDIWTPARWANTRVSHS